MADRSRTKITGHRALPLQHQAVSRCARAADGLSRSGVPHAYYLRTPLKVTVAVASGASATFLEVISNEYRVVSYPEMITE